MWSNTTSYSVKRLHSGNGGEYVTLELQFFLRKQEIIHETSTLYIYQQNSCAEQLNCTLLEKTQSMQLEACLLYSWWKFAIAATVENTSGDLLEKQTQNITLLYL